MDVNYIDKLGTDLTIVNAARVSFDKTSELEGGALPEKDKKLIRFLAQHNHWSPFAHAQIQFRVKAPVFVARQLVKHQVGGVWNEVSRRYVDSTPEFYWPEKWRGRPLDKKQGSEEGVYIDTLATRNVMNLVNQLVDLYEQLIVDGVAPEQARMVLPQNMYTEWYWTGSVYFFARVAKLRTKSDAQEETRFIADLIAKQCAKHFPVSWANLL